MSVSDLVGEIDGLRSQTRKAKSGGAVPLAILGVLVLVASLYYAGAWNGIRGDSDGIIGLEGLVRRPGWLVRLLHLQPGFGYETLAVFWLVAVPVAFAAIAGYYAWHARRTGVSVRGGRVAVAGLATLAGLITVMEVADHMTPGFQRSDLRPANFLNPLLVVVAGAFAIAWVERSLGVLVVAVVFLLGVLAVDARVLSDSGSETAWDNIQSWGTAIACLGAWLLAGAGVLAIARRR